MVIAFGLAAEQAAASLIGSATARSFPPPQSCQHRPIERRDVAGSRREELHRQVSLNGRERMERVPPEIIATVVEKMIDLPCAVPRADGRPLRSRSGPVARW